MRVGWKIPPANQRLLVQFGTGFGTILSKAISGISQRQEAIPEGRARLNITRMLEAAGWNYREEAVAGRQGRVGFADYRLLDSHDQAVALLEAKHAGTPPLSAKERARDYADSIGIKHVFLSNGELHYHWVTDSGNPVRILTFPKPGELGQIRGRAINDRSPLWDTKVGEHFLRKRTMRY